MKVERKSGFLPIKSKTRNIYLYRINTNSAMRAFSPYRFQAISAIQDLEPMMLKLVPDFYPLYQKYASSRNCWSLLWQASVFLSFQDFITLYEKNNFRYYIKKLLTFPEIKVTVSSAILLACPLVFYLLARYYAKHRLFNTPNRHDKTKKL